MKNKSETMLVHMMVSELAKMNTMMIDGMEGGAYLFLLSMDEGEKQDARRILT